MAFQNLQVTEVCLHQIFQRADDRSPVPPVVGSQLLQLDQEAKDTFIQRVNVAIGRDAQCIDMAIVEFAAGSSVAIAEELTIGPASSFATSSAKFAHKLTDAQKSRAIPGGMLAVFRGTAGYPARPLVGVIKAEMQEGFRPTASLQVQYFKDLFLTRQTKLYKLGIFSLDPGSVGSLPSGWQATVYDSQMSQADREGAALYFYETFLGCAFPVDSARLTRQFFQKTRDFINQLPVDEEQKADLYTGLYTYLKVDQTPTIHVDTFGTQNMPPDMADDYAAYMAAESFPAAAIQKDLSDVAGYLKKRRMRFARNLQLVGPPEAFSELVEIESSPQGDGATWTRLTIKAPIESQE